MKVSIVGSLRDREVACSASDRQDSNFESCVWRTVSSQSSHHPQEVLLAQFSLYVHKGGLKPDSFHFYLNTKYNYKNITLGEESQIWEKKFLEITRRNCTYKLILGNIYRPPCELNDNHSLFNLVLSQLNNFNCEGILASDYNIDLINVNTKQTISEFLI